MKNYFFYTDFIIVRSERKWEVFNSVMIYTVFVTTYRFLSELQSFRRCFFIFNFFAWRNLSFYKTICLTFLI